MPYDDSAAVAAGALPATQLENAPADAPVRPTPQDSIPEDNGQPGVYDQDAAGTVAEDSSEETAAVDTPAVSDDPYADFGGADTVKSAVEIYKALQTDEGVADLFFQAGRALGLGVKEINSLFGGAEAPAEEDPMGGLSDDDVVTVAQMKQMLAEQNARYEQMSQEQKMAQGRQAVEQTFERLNITDPGTRSAILRLSDPHLKDLTPQSVVAAIQKGYEDFENLVKANAEKYVQEKAAQKAKLPKSGGSTATPPAHSAADDPEPTNIKEAIARARRNMGLAGNGSRR